MFVELYEFIRLLLGIYDRMEPEEKEKLINSIVEAYDAILRAFYRSYSGGAA